MIKIIITKREGEKEKEREKECYTKHIFHIFNVVYRGLDLICRYETQIIITKFCILKVTVLLQ